MNSSTNRSMIHWPDELVDDIARRRSVIYLGAGVSASSKNKEGKSPPTWDEFLRGALSHVEQNAKNNGHIEVVKKLIETKEYLMACDIIVDLLGDREFANLADQSFRNEYETNELHKKIYVLDSRFVMTSNVDLIYEAYAMNESRQGAITKTYDDDDIARFLRPKTKDYLIIKAHGSIEKPNTLIFTQSQYSRVRNIHSSFYKILDALLLTHTFIFLGCGVKDPDIQLALENLNFNFNGAKPHYMVIPSDGMSDAEERCLERNRNLKFLKYNNDDGKHSNLLDELNKLCQLVEDRREELGKITAW
mgnify:CR=1 FL=1